MLEIILALGAVGLAASCAHPPNAPDSRTGPATAIASNIPHSPIVAAHRVVADVLRFRMVREADFTELSAITLDPLGTPIVGGGLNVERPGMQSAFVSKLKADGEPEWTTSFVGNAAVVGLIADRSGNVWVAGWYRGRLDASSLSLVSRGNDRDAFVAKLSPTGLVLALARFGDGSYYAATAIALEASGDPVVYGACKRARASDLCVTLLDDAGQSRQTQQLNVPGASPGGFSVASWGSVLYAGHAPTRSMDRFGGHHPPYDGLLVGRRDAHGGVDWNLELGGRLADTKAYAIAGDPSNRDSVLAGTFSGTASIGHGAMRSRGGTDIFVMKLSDARKPRWLRRFGDTGWDRPNALAIAPNGHIIVAGAFEDDLGFGNEACIGLGATDGFVAALSSTGQPLWAVRLMAPGVDTVRALAVAPSGHVWAVGTSATSAQGPGTRDGAAAFIAEIAERDSGKAASPVAAIPAPASTAVHLAPEPASPAPEPSLGALAQATEQASSACERGDLATLRRWVPSVVPTSALGHSGWPLLTLAAYHGKASVIRYLVQHGADPNQGSTDRYSPLKQAARWGNLNAVAALIESGTDVNAGDGTDKGTALSILVEEKQDDPELVRYLLQHGARPDCRSARGLTALMVAIEHGRESSVMELLSAQADVNALDRDGHSVLAWAAMVGTAELAIELLGRGAAADTPDSSGMTPLFHAAHAGNSQIVKVLLSGGASPNPVESRHGDSALMRAANGGHIEVVRALLDRAAPIDMANLEGLTALHMAARNGEDEVVRHLVARGAALSHVDREGRTAEALATKNGHHATAALLKSLSLAKP